MSGSRQLHLGAFMRPTTIHTGAWHYPGAFPDANLNLAHINRFAQTLERGRLYRISNHARKRRPNRILFRSPLRGTGIRHSAIRVFYCIYTCYHRVIVVIT